MIGNVLDSGDLLPGRAIGSQTSQLPKTFQKSASLVPNQQSEIRLCQKDQSVRILKARCFLRKFVSTWRSKWNLSQNVPSIAATEGKNAVFGLVMSSDFLFLLSEDEASEDFFLFSSSLYHSFKKYMVGGPSICYRRKTTVGKTKIRENQLGPQSKVSQELIVYDFNAWAYIVMLNFDLWCDFAKSCRLYASVLMKTEMPIGPYYLRVKKDSFRPLILADAHYSIVWLSYMEMKTKRHIASVFKGGEQKIHLSKSQKWVMVDGVSRENNMLYCYEWLECGGNQYDWCILLHMYVAMEFYF